MDPTAQTTTAVHNTTARSAPYPPPHRRLRIRPGGRGLPASHRSEAAMPVPSGGDAPGRIPDSAPRRPGV